MQRMARIGLRLQEIRKDLYGEGGAAILATALDMPQQTWLN